jgi:translation initiation factor 1 (eIF-1/SUI1)
MPTWPAKTNYATGDVLTAAQMQDIGNALNSVGSAQYAAGKNVFINADFKVNQRNFTSGTTTNDYCADRWPITATSGTTVTRENFTAGSAPVAGYEGTQFIRLVTTGQTATNTESSISQRIESARTFANQIVTVSFWAKAASGTPKIAVELRQNFGTGGSPSSTTSTPLGFVTISTSWTRYSLTGTVPSVAGKTFGTTTDGLLAAIFFVSAGSDLNTRASSIGIQSGTFDFWGMQIEAGSVATPFQTATGTLQGETALCQRYYYRLNAAGLSNYPIFGFGWANTSNNIQITSQFPVTMRVKPTAIDTSAMSTFAWEFSNSAGNTPTSITLDSNYSSPNNGQMEVTKSGAFTLNQQYRFQGNNSSGAYIGWSAEL